MNYEFNQEKKEMKYKIIFNFAIKLIGLYYIINSITNFELTLSILLSYTPDNSDNLIVNLTQIFFIFIQFITNLFIILKSEKILDLIYKNNKSDLDIIVDTHNTNGIDNINLLNFINASVILIGFIIVISNISDLILSIKDYYNVMIDLGDINAKLKVVTFYGKPALLNSIIGLLIVIFQNKISNLISNNIKIENLKSKV